MSISKKYRLSVTKDHFDIKTICLIGRCSYCKDEGDNNLIIYDFKADRTNKPDSVFKTICMKCNMKSFVMLKDVDAESSKDYGN